MTTKSNGGVTVAIPTYDRPALLREALDSVLAQDMEDFEILVVDDASRADTESVVASFGDRRIRLFRQASNVGMQRNWRTALCMPNSRYVALLEDDNLWLPHHLRAAVTALDEHRDATMYCCTSEMFGGGRDGPFKPYWCTGVGREIWRWQDMGYARWLAGCPILASSVVMRQECLDGLVWGRSYGPWCHDWLWWGQLALRGAVLFDNEIGMRYRWHESNATYGFRNMRSRAEWLYTIRELATRAWEAGGLRDLPSETAAFSAAELSILVIALSAPGTPAPLRRQALRLVRTRREIASEPGCAMNFRIATVIGSWWLRHAYLRTRLLGGGDW
jgi:glycosyltransferase involved in cell wall biosynthesis